MCVCIKNDIDGVVEMSRAAYITVYVYVYVYI